jgi:hypothetical protein
MNVYAFLHYHMLATFTTCYVIDLIILILFLSLSYLLLLLLEHRASVKRFFHFSFVILTQSVGLLGRGISPSQTNIHALSGIRTHDPSVRASEDSSCLRPRDHYDRPNIIWRGVKIMKLSIMLLEVQLVLN